MARRFISELSPGEFIEDEIYCLAQKDLRSTTNGSLYIHAVLSDKTGQIPARMWQASEDLYKELEQQGFVRVRGRTENYKGSLQFIIEGIRPVSSDEVNVEDFLPHTERDIEEMFERMLEILRKIKNRNLLFLLKEFLDDKELMEKFKRAPAAVNMHHSYLGGLLEHTLNLLELALFVGTRYSQINPDLLLAGVFLHDIGKTQELEYEIAFKYSDEGQLVGHLVIGAIMVEKKARLVQEKTGQEFPRELIQMLQHIILSHHGEHEFGSPVLPKTAEAVALHYLDNLDAKVEQIRAQVEKSQQSDPESNWTGYIKSLERPLFKKNIMD